MARQASQRKRCLKGGRNPDGTPRPKRPFLTQDSAQAFLDRSPDRYRGQGREIYQCGHCHNYHIGRPKREP